MDSALTQPEGKVSDFLFPQSRCSPAARYLFAVLMCAAAFCLRLLLDPLLADHSPLLLFGLAVAASAIRGGLGPGLLATAVSGFLAMYYFPPLGAFLKLDPAYRATAVFQELVFLVVGLLLSWLSGSLLSLRWKAVDLARQRNEILESITDGFAALDYNRRLVYCNRTAAQWIGADPDRVLGQVVWDAVPDWKDSPVESGCREVAERNVAVRFEYQSRGSGRWFDMHLNPGKNGGLTVYFSDITERKATEAERNAALQSVRLLSGLLPICAACKKIRNRRGVWEQLETYISAHSEAEFSHGLCPDCARDYFAEIPEA